jgi:hypothetical protein
VSKLNGWQRIGVLASVVWIVGAGLYTQSAMRESDSRAAAAISLDCESYIVHGITTLAECDKRNADYNAKTYSGEWIGAAVVAFVPVPLGWGFAYLALFLTRWIRRGFTPRSE